MNFHELKLVSSGAILFGYLIIALYFWRSWSVSRDPLLRHFAIAFGLLVLERVLLLGSDADFPHRPLIYLTRLVAFLVIIWAIWDKNRVREDR